MITSVLVANRGEIARRVFRTCRDLGIETVAVFSDADADAPFVAEADRSVRLPGNSPAETYLRGDLIIAAAHSAGAEAIHPGYGFLSENADFARDVVAAGLSWIGPSAESIEDMGSKIRAKEIMAKAGVPILDVDVKTATAEDYPLLVKASAGGGGRGMRVVTRAADLDDELAKAEAEALSSFGDGTVFVEPYLPTARHIEVQVMADESGNCWIVGDRDCSIQRNHQKVVEEAPAPRVSDAVRSTLHTAARAAVEAVGYRGAGTVEFLVSDAQDPDGRAYFLEMNTRLQVEHPVTEEVFGTDLVALQIAVAEGKTLEGEPVGPTGHAIEVRLYAEDPAHDWQPQTGTIRGFDFPTGPGLRVDSAVEVGSVVGIHYDAMLGKVIAYGQDRDTALRILRNALRKAKIHGVTTNIELLRAILADEAFAAGKVHTALLGERLEAWSVSPFDESITHRYALAAAIADARKRSEEATVLRRVPTAFRNVPSQPRTRTYRRGDTDIAVTYENRRDRLTPVGWDRTRVIHADPQRVVIDHEGIVEAFDVALGSQVDIDGPAGSMTLVAVPDFLDPAEVVAEGSLLAPMPAAVASVSTENGHRVSKGDVIVVLEAMKMQHTITAPSDGVVTELSVKAGDQVESGAVLALIQDTADGETA